MSFEQSEVSAFAGSLPEGALNGVGKQAIEEWFAFLLGVDPAPKSRHDLFWYLSVGRLLGETMGSSSPLDLAQPVIRDMITNTIKPLEKPYDKEGESGTFRAWAVLPAQVAFALRVQEKCAAAEPPPPTPQATLATTMKAYSEAQAASHKRAAKALSFDLANRKVDVGMATS